MKYIYIKFKEIIKGKLRYTKENVRTGVSSITSQIVAVKQIPGKILTTRESDHDACCSSLFHFTAILAMCQ